MQDADRRDCRTHPLFRRSQFGQLPPQRRLRTLDPQGSAPVRPSSTAPPTLTQAGQPKANGPVKGLTTSLARSGIGILISLVCVYLALRGVDLGQTASIMSGAKLPWLCLAVVGVSLDLVFRALRWQRLIAPIHPVPLRRLSGYMLVGYLANNVLPARLGELVRSHYLGDREGISRSATLGTVVVERVVDTVVLVGIGAAAILILNIRGVVVSAILVGVALAGLLVVALAVALAAHRLPGARHIADFLGRWPRVKGVVLRLRDGLRVAALPKTIAAAALLSVVAWSCTVLAVLATGQALGLSLIHI